jgi:hypothetical protein
MLIVLCCDENDLVFFSAFSFQRSTGGIILTGENQSTRRKTCHSATLSTTNPIWTEPGSNPGLRGERPATSHYLRLLVHGIQWPWINSIIWTVHVTTMFNPKSSNHNCFFLLYVEFSYWTVITDICMSISVVIFDDELKHVGMWTQKVVSV